MLKSFNFDPKELRGIGIQVQKLESASGETNPEPGQAKLPFQTADIPSKGQRLMNHKGDMQVNIEPLPEPEMGPPVAGLSKPSSDHGLPSLSQIDMDVFNSLPEDLRDELESEFKRRAHSLPQPEVVPTFVSKPKPKITIKGTNHKRIAQQLAPKNRPAMTSPMKNRLLAKQAAGPSAVHVSHAELRKLNIDGAVFANLPVDIQREQLALAREAKAAGVAPLKLVQRIVIKPLKSKPRSSGVIYRHPPPQANYPKPPSLKQRGEEGGKIRFTEAEEVQRVIEAWVEGFREEPPNAQDVDNFGKFLAQSVDGSQSTDVGIEKAVRVLKWWLVLLRRHWELWEHLEDGIDDDGEINREETMTSEIVGKAWWRAFRDVKERVDLTLRKKFGGRLSLK